MMKNLRIATAQFENSSGDKEANLSKISKMTGEAASEGAEVIFMPHVTMCTPSTRPDERFEPKNCVVGQIKNNPCKNNALHGL